MIFRFLGVNAFFSSKYFPRLSIAPNILKNICLILHVITARGTVRELFVEDEQILLHKIREYP